MKTIDKRRKKEFFDADQAETVRQENKMHEIMHE